VHYKDGILRFIIALTISLSLAASGRAQSMQLPDAPQPMAGVLVAGASVPNSRNIFRRRSHHAI